MKVSGNPSVTDKEAATERMRLTVGVLHHEEDSRAKRLPGNLLNRLRARRASEDQGKS